ncbi:MAG: hypothetical protein AAF517_09050 [Planctomycetota bacterium]
MTTDTSITTLCTGELPELLSIKSALECQGFHPLVADRHIQHIDPFVTGGYAFQTRLIVPSNEAQLATEALSSLREDAAAQRQIAEENGVDPVEATRLFGRRLCFGAMLVFLFSAILPIATLGSATLILFWFRYLWQVRVLPERPAGFRFVNCAVPIAVVSSATIAWTFYAAWRLF